MDEMLQTYDGNAAKLTFKEIYPEDEGTYDCVAKNTVGQVKTSCALKVRCKIQPSEMY